MRRPWKQSSGFHQAGMAAIPGNRRPRSVVGCLVLLAVLSATLAIAQEEPLELVMSAFLVTEVTEAGKTAEKLAALPDGVVPGDVIEYRIEAANRVDWPLTQIQLVGPVPEGTAYVDQTAACDAQAELTASIDNGGTYRTPPLTVQVTLADGTVVEQVVPAERYTHLRYTIAAVEPGGTAVFRYRVTVK